METSDEWHRQAAYDLDTAFFLFDGGRFFYAAFMAHLAAEKALKGLYQRRTSEVPPRTHSLVDIAAKLHLDLPVHLAHFVDSVDDLSVSSRYPAELESALREYTVERARYILELTSDLISWIDQQ